MGTRLLRGTYTGRPSIVPMNTVLACVSEPYQFASCTPSFVRHVTFCLLASMPAVIVVPLFPPQPTSMSPVFGTRRSVRKSKDCVVGVTRRVPLALLHRCGGALRLDILVLLARDLLRARRVLRRHLVDACLSHQPLLLGALRSLRLLARPHLAFQLLLVTLAA